MDGEAAGTDHVGGLETHGDPRRMLARHPNKGQGETQQHYQRQRRLEKTDMSADQVTDCHLSP